MKAKKWQNIPKRGYRENKAEKEEKKLIKEGIEEDINEVKQMQKEQ